MRKFDAFDFAAVFLVALFLSASLLIIRDYGFGIDELKNSAEGRENLNFLLSGKSNGRLLKTQLHGAFSFMIADATRRVFTDRFHLLNRVLARHIILPFWTALFLLPFFFFVKKYCGPPAALMALLSLVTYPYFFGHTFNNLKDIPLLIMMSLSLMSFFKWRESGKLKDWYQFIFYFGAALSIKLYALVVLLIIFTWMLLSFIQKPEPTPDNQKNWPVKRFALHAMIGTVAILLMVSLLYAPSFWGSADKLGFLKKWCNQSEFVLLNQVNSWNLYSFRQVFYRTPVVMLFFALWGFLKSVKTLRQNRFTLFLCLWMLIPLAIPCLPGMRHYNGMRHYMMFLVPFSIFAAVGVFGAAKMVSSRIKFLHIAIGSGLAALMISFNLWGLISTHPFQTTFFNAFAGGLGGAQEKNIPDSFDYWLTSFKQAGEWLDAHAEKDSKVLVFHQQWNLFSFLLKPSVKRRDLTLDARSNENSESIQKLDHAYIVFVPFTSDARNTPRHRGIRAEIFWVKEDPSWHEVYRMTRQGGEILTIYYKPRS